MATIYGSETWTKTESRWESEYMCLRNEGGYREIRRIDSLCFEETGNRNSPLLLVCIKSRMLTYFGHIILTNGLEKLYKGESSDEEGEEKVVD